MILLLLLLGCCILVDNCFIFLLFYFRVELVCPVPDDGITLNSRRTDMKVVVVGAGPSGLVAAKTLLESASEDFPFDPILLEQEEDIGGTFRYRSYQVGSLLAGL